MGPYQKWLLSNPAGLVAAGALTCATAAGLFVGIGQVRCTLIEEDFAKTKSRFTEEIESLRAEQDTNYKALADVVSETVRRVAAHLKDTREGEPRAEPAKEEATADDPPKDEPEKEPE
jgi:hypothetical protein